MLLKKKRCIKYAVLHKKFCNFFSSEHVLGGDYMILFGWEEILPRFAGIPAVL